MDNLFYFYHDGNSNPGNTLRKVEDATTNSWADIDYRDNGMHDPEEYFYDGNGNMIEDKNKGITVAYNYMNLPETVTWADGRKIEDVRCQRN